MMFTSCLTILALLTLLAGANAGCATCQETLKVGSSTYELVSSYVESENGYTECSYVDKKGDEVTCVYTDDGKLANGDWKCPGWSRKDECYAGCDVKWARREEQHWSAESWVYQRISSASRILFIRVSPGPVCDNQSPRAYRDNECSSRPVSQRLKFKLGRVRPSTIWKKE
ncbi:hypothetical protein EV424DRAFT_292250 [Suillus variegatus]|nr:hypothetical protein EV424DRAFT_292250 [Suillus variegatus]